MASAPATATASDRSDARMIYWSRCVVCGKHVGGLSTCCGRMSMRQHAADGGCLTAAGGDLD
eukprot:16348912-Heterocapsa_arctica.AAC.1